MKSTRGALAIARDEDVREVLAEGGLLVQIPVLARSSKSSRVNINVDRGVLAAIDEAAAARQLSRSAFLAEAALLGMDETSFVTTAALERARTTLDWH